MKVLGVQAEATKMYSLVRVPEATAKDPASIHNRSWMKSLF